MEDNTLEELFRRDPFGFSKDQNFGALVEYNRARRNSFTWARRHYLDALPASIPEGRLLAHNGARPHHKVFRFWHQPTAEGLEPCECDWAPDLAPHYRGRRAG